MDVKLLDFYFYDDFITTSAVFLADRVAGAASQTVLSLSHWFIAWLIEQVTLFLTWLYAAVKAKRLYNFLSLVQKLWQFYWMGENCLLLELHQDTFP